MKIGRIASQTPDGDVARLVLVYPQDNRVLDLKKAWTASLVGKGATHEAALRHAAALFPPSMSDAIALGDEFLVACRAVDAAKPVDAFLSMDDVRWLPASDPSVVRDGLCFIDHIRGFHEKMNAKPPASLLEVPGYFKGNPSQVVAHDEEILWPSFIKKMDYELELGWIVGRRATNLTPEEARSCIFGVTIFNDFSARDRQAVEMPIGMGPQKCKDFAFGIGPWIVTMDEFEDLTKLTGRVRVNGEIWSENNTGNQLWSPEELVAYVSTGEWIQPGDMIGSGTMGKGAALELDRDLSPGDVIELEVDGIGVLRNRLGQVVETRWWPEKRQPFM